MDIQVSQLKKHVEHEKTFEGNAIIEFNKLNTVATTCVLDLRNQLASGQAALRHEALIESNVRTMLHRLGPAQASGMLSEVLLQRRLAVLQALLASPHWVMLSRCSCPSTLPLAKTTPSWR